MSQELIIYTYVFSSANTLCVRKIEISEQRPSCNRSNRFFVVLRIQALVSQGGTSMTSKFSLAALALVAALLSLPSGANAGFVGRDRFWGDVDARMHRLWSFRWLCRDRVAAAKPVKARRHKHGPTK
jgi:hypothetical protein